MTSSFTGEFARLIPCNKRAKDLFSDCLTYVQKNDPFHVNFMVPVDEASSSHQVVESAVEDDSSFYGSSVEYIPPDLDVGYFILSFEGDGLSEYPNLGWRVGLANKRHAHGNVDLLLSHIHGKSTRSLAYNHFRLWVNPQTGFLVLEAGSNPKASLRYQNLEGVWEKLEPKDTRLMFARCTRLRAGRCEYNLTYTVTEEQKDSFVNQRNKFIERTYPEQPNSYQVFKRIPGERPRESFGSYLKYETRGYGTFGWVDQAVCTRTGNIVAIKQVDRKSRSDQGLIEQELRLGRRFINETGLVPVIDSFCDHGLKYPCGKPERFSFVMPFAVADLVIVRNHPKFTGTYRLEILQGPLQGLKTLHNSGMMHRDIRTANILVMSVDPPRACLCDYGKATEEKSSYYTFIGPIHTLAPEVWTTETTGPYNQSIDIWAFGYAIAEVLGYSCKGNEPISKERHRDILISLDSHFRKYPEDTSLVDLACRMLAWDARNRPSAAQALEHVCWKAVRDRNESKSSTIKRKLEDGATDRDKSSAGPRSGHETVLLQSQRTEEFSEESKTLINQIQRESSVS